MTAGMDQDTAAMGAASGGTVGKALAVLDLVAQFGRPVRLLDLVPISPYPKPSLYRFLQTLVGQGMLTYDPEFQTYALGVRLVRLAHAAWRQASLAPVARPHIEALAARMGETVHLAQLDHAQVLYVDKRNPSRPVDMFSEAGKIGPAYCTGVGKAMLAFLPPATLDEVLRQQSFYGFTPHTLTSAEALRADLAEIRAKGFALDREEHEPGIICVAVPIRSAHGQVMGALSVTSTTQRRSLAELETLAPDVTQVATLVAQDAEAWRFPDTADPTEGDIHVRSDA